MVRFMKGAHHDIRKTSSNFYQGMVRPYHGNTQGVMFSNHVFHFLYSTSMVFQTVLVHLFMHRLFEFELYPLMPRKCTQSPKYGKWARENVKFEHVAFEAVCWSFEKTEWQTRTKIWIPLQSWGFLSRKHGTSSVMVRFMKGVHDDIRQTFSNFYQGMVRSYHGTMSGVMFFKHLFHFFYSWKPNKQTFVVDYCQTFHRNIYPFLVKGLRIY